MHPARPLRERAEPDLPRAGPTAPRSRSKHGYEASRSWARSSIVLGFLTTNAYLYKLGVSDFSLLRTRFILTEVLTLAPLTLALIGGIYAALDVMVFGGHARLTTRAYLWILADIALPFALYFNLFSVVAENNVVTSARDAAMLSAVCAVIVLAVLAALAIYRKSDRVMKWDSHRDARI